MQISAGRAERNPYFDEKIQAQFRILPKNVTRLNKITLGILHKGESTGDEMPNLIDIGLNNGVVLKISAD